METYSDATEKLNRWIVSNSRALMASLLVAHAGLLVWSDAKNSPNPDETAHLAAGMAIWRFGRIDLYQVNPPLVRAIAGLPVVHGCRTGNWTSLDEEQHNTTGVARPEWSVGIKLVRDNPDRAMWFFALARWGCIPLSLIGGYVCWRWARELYGTWAAAVALTLWCFSPNVIAWSATICPDSAAASFGIAACYFFWRWLKKPDWFLALLAGIVFGLAELTKMTWIILFAVWPVIWLFWRWGRQHDVMRRRWSRQVLQLVCILSTGLFVLNLGYSFSGTFTSLGNYTFASHTLAGADSVICGGRGGNRFADNWLRYVPVPLPRSYVEGVDLQKVDFERGLPSYLFGQWSQHGWWYYYIACAILKVPLGIWVLGLLAVGAKLGRLRLIASRRPHVGHAECLAYWRNEVALLLPAIALIVFVSSQTGFSRHFRYVLPAFPFLFVWISSVAQAALRKPWTMTCVGSLLAWAAISSLWLYPHNMSYFNELAGGPMGGPRYLLDASIDWGQDVLYLKKWCEKHPEATPLYVAFNNSYSRTLLGFGERVRNLDALKATNHEQAAEDGELLDFGSKPNWYAISIHRMNDPSDHYLYFRQFTPADTAGYSIYIYYVTLEDADRLRNERSSPERNCK